MSNYFLEQGLKLIDCRKELEIAWESLSKGKVEQIPSFDHIEIVLGQYDRTMRQVNNEANVVQTLTELYAVASIAQERFSTLITTTVLSAGLPSEHLHLAPLKGCERAAEKAKDDYDNRKDGPGIAWLFDIVRGMVICETEDEICSLVQTLLEHQDESNFEIVRLKNRFKTSTPAGFRDINMNIKMSVPLDHNIIHHICELQIHCRPIKEMAKAMGSHGTYEYFRVYFRGSAGSISERIRVLDDVVSNIRLDNGSTDLSAVDQLADNAIAVDDIPTLKNLVTLMSCMCEYSRAVGIQAHILRHNEGALGGTNDETLASRKTLANLHYFNGDFKAARPHYAALVVEYEAQVGPLHINSLLALGMVANTHRDAGEYPQAVALYECVMARIEDAKLLAKGDSQSGSGEKVAQRRLCFSGPILGVMRNYGTVLSEMGDHSKAEEIYRIVLQTSLEVYGRESLDALDCIHCIGTVLHKQGNNEAALQLYEEALQGKEKILGREHADTITICSNLGIVAQELDHFDEARDHLERVCVWREATLGATHPETLAGWNNLAVLLKKIGDLRGALVLHERALLAKETTLGATHPSTLASVNNIGALWQEEGRLDEARSCYERALAGYEAAFGPTHQHYLCALNNLGEVLLLIADHAAVRPGSRIISDASTSTDTASTKATTSTSTSTGTSTLAIACIVEIDQFDSVPRGVGVEVKCTSSAAGPGPPKEVVEALAMFEEALKGFELIVGPRHEICMTVTENIAKACLQMGNFRRARACFERVLRFRDSLRKGDVIEVLRGLVNTCNAMGGVEGISAAERYAARLGVLGEATSLARKDES